MPNKKTFIDALPSIPDVGTDTDFERINDEDEQNRKAMALATLAKYRSRFKAEKFNREECHDR